MKIALYIEDGLEQIVLTPQTKAEKYILEKLHEGRLDLAVKRGNFYYCRGGYVTQGYSGGYNGWLDDSRTDNDSTMLILRPAPAAEPEAGDGC